MFYKTVGNSKKAMVEFLQGHFRYNTMNSWNNATSYANCVKLHKIFDVVPDIAYEMLEITQVWGEINHTIRKWEEKHDYTWQAGFNGRSGGYIVLYQGGKKDEGYKTQCDECERLTWYESEQKCHVEGCEGTLRKLENPAYRVFSYPGKSLDMDADFEEWDIYSLKERVRLIQDFDRLCDECVSIFKNYCKNYKIKEEEVLVPKKVKVLV